MGFQLYLAAMITRRERLERIIAIIVGLLAIATLIWQRPEIMAQAEYFFGGPEDEVLNIFSGNWKIVILFPVLLIVIFTAISITICGDIEDYFADAGFFYLLYPTLIVAMCIIYVLVHAFLAGFANVWYGAMLYLAMLIGLYLTALLSLIGVLKTILEH